MSNVTYISGWQVFICISKNHYWLLVLVQKMASLVLTKFFHTHKTPLNQYCKRWSRVFEHKNSFRLGNHTKSHAFNIHQYFYEQNQQEVYKPVPIPPFSSFLTLFLVVFCIPTKSPFILKTLWLYHLRAVDGFLCWIRIGIFSFISIHIYLSF